LSPVSTSHGKHEIGTPVDDFTLTAVGGVDNPPVNNTIHVTEGRQGWEEVYKR
jgi:hypothetical protein